MPTAAIIGGGLCGCLAAVLLVAEHEFSVEIYESRERETDFDGHGNGRSTLDLTLNSRGVAALKRAGVFDKVEEYGRWLQGYVWGWKGTCIEEAYKDGRLLSINRRVLHGILVSRCESLGVKFYFSHKIDEEAFRGLVQERSLVVGADGINSTVRSILFGSAHKCSTVSFPLIDSSMNKSVQTVEFELGYVEVVVPAPGWKSFLRIWSSKTRDDPYTRVPFILGVPDRNEQIDLGVYAPLAILQDIPRLKQLLKNDFSCKLLELLQDVPDTSWGAPERLCTVLSPRCLSNFNNVVLLGDAAATKLPFLGLGANSSMEDASIFSNALENTNIPKSIECYWTHRNPDLMVACQLSIDEGYRLIRKTPGPRSTHPGKCTKNMFDILAFSDLTYSETVESFRSQSLHNQHVTARGPGWKSYVHVGQRVTKGDIVGIIDSVKTRGTYAAPQSGIVRCMDTLEAFSIEPDQVSTTNQTVSAAGFLFDGCLFQEWLTRLGVSRFGRFTMYRKLTNSTMSDAATEAEHGAVHGSLFIAEKQENGRGRGGMKWASEYTGNIYMTLVCEIGIERLGVIAPLAVLRAVKELGLQGVSIKWPNDIYCGNAKKLSGLLVEVKNTRALVGIGINVHQNFTDGESATSIADQWKQQNTQYPCRERVVAQVCAHFQTLLSTSPSKLLELYAASSAVFGKLIKVTSKCGKSTCSVLSQEKNSHVELQLPLECFAKEIDIEGRLKIQLISDGAEYWLHEHDSSVQVFQRAVFVYTGPGADPRCIDMTMAMTEQYLGAAYNIFSINPTVLVSPENQWESICELIIFPGGADLPMIKSLGELGQTRIRNFVHNGGKYLGFCAGAYFACSAILFDEGGPLQVVGKRSLRFFDGIGVGPTLSGFIYGSSEGAWAASLSVRGMDRHVYSYYNGGCNFESNPDDTTSQILATYSPIHENEAPLNAIIKCRVGRGVAVLSGVHPEFDPTKDVAIWEKEGVSKLQPVSSPQHISYSNGVHSAIMQTNNLRCKLVSDIFYQHLGLDNAHR